MPLDTEPFKNVFLSEDTAPVKEQKAFLRRLGFQIRHIQTVRGEDAGAVIKIIEYPDNWYTRDEEDGSGALLYFDRRGHLRFELLLESSGYGLTPYTRYNIDYNEQEDGWLVVDYTVIGGRVIQNFTGTHAKKDAEEWLNERASDYANWDAYWDQPPIEA